VNALARQGGQPALITDDGVVTYAELGQSVAEATSALGADRRLLLLRAGNDVGSVVWYLAALTGRHPALLVSPNDVTALESLQAAYEPDLVLDASTTADHAERLTSSAGPRHDLHPSLSLLLSTSGSTGSPKLVRLSRRNVWSNAAAIARYLHLSNTDRAFTTLPMQYCYGLSVINSHLIAGASVVLQNSSVLDSVFWDRFTRLGATSLAGVPHTFDLLDRIGFDDFDLPSLRLVTTAGGRLEPERVRRYALLGQARGWRFYAMYGQTEATARMAYLTPGRAVASPSSIGAPIDKGSFELDTGQGEAGQADGELIYRGPNVMLGYAQNPTDLALGRTIESLHTGDLARRTPDGSFEIVGRRHRFIKPYGQRIDLQILERLLSTQGIRAAVGGDDRRLVIGCESKREAQKARALAAEASGVPPSTIAALTLETIPRRENGKVDYEQLLSMADANAEEPPPPTSTRSADLADLYRAILAVDEVDATDTFVSLGGDSLNYVKLSIELEERLGRLPSRWHETTIADLERSVEDDIAATGTKTRQETPGPSPRSRWYHQTDTTVALRAIAMILIVSTHGGVATLPAGAHILLGVAGFNYARFQLRSHHPWRSIARVAIPSMLWIGGLWLLTDDYDITSPLLLHNVVGSTSWSAPWRYWFIDVLVQILIAATLLLAVPRIRALARANPFLFSYGLVVLAIVLRHDPFDLLLNSREAGRTLTALWAFTIGWAAAEASTIRQRLAVSVAVPLAVLGFFPNPVRVGMITVGLLALIWLPRVVLPTVANRVAGLVASASLYIYLTHWETQAFLQGKANSLTATVVAIAVGIAVWAVVARAGPLSRRLRLPSHRHAGVDGRRPPSLLT
jgi:acyl-CoA synthetase (AMP-forming)/AMP-acid ligase II/acyl carrier protein